jgi:hypothetical protein
MVMNKASDGDSPLRQGARKSFWTLPISCRRWRRLAVGFVENWSGLRFFPSRGIYRRKGGVMRWTRAAYPLVAWARAWPRCPRVWLARGHPPSHLWTSSRVWKNRRFSFCFVKFREYLLCSFSKTQKTAENRELALWCLVSTLVPENA